MEKNPSFSSSLPELLGYRNLTNLFSKFILQISTETVQLFANNNQISNITFEDQAKITHLDLAFNQMTDITSIANLSTLQYLDLSGNSIGRLSLDKFSALEALIRLG
jgi:Leucine-rich repeat (LRR) protein